MDKYKINDISSMLADSKNTPKNNAFNIIPSFPNRSLFVGSTSAGKTNLLVSLLVRDEFLKDFFDEIYFWSPNANSEEINTLIAKKNQSTKVEYIDDVNVSDFKKKVNKIFNDQKKAKSMNEMKKILFIIDDSASNKKLLKSKILKDVYFFSRKLFIQTFLLTQYYKAIPAALRQNSEHLILFSTLPKSEIKKVGEENSIGKYDDKFFYQVFNDLSSKGLYNFLHINKKLKPDERFYFNFENSIKVD